MDGRVKTLHPKVHGGLLARRDAADACAALRGAGIAPIDLLVVNLYPFAATVAEPDCTFEDAIENIDIGGPAMVRAAAKNHAHVAVVVDPADYAAVLDELRAAGGAVGATTRFELARESVRAHRGVRRRDRQLSDRARRSAARRSVSRGAQPAVHESCRTCATARIRIRARRSIATRDPAPGSIAALPPAAGQGALVQQHRRRRRRVGVRQELRPSRACVIVKHANPCGVAHRATTLAEPIDRRSRPIRRRRSAASSRSIARSMRTTAEAIVERQFVEVIDRARASSRKRTQLFARKANVRVLEVPLAPTPRSALEYQARGRRPAGADARLRRSATADLKVVTKRSADATRSCADLLFAWRVAKYVKSNAIVFAASGMTLGVGAGQMSRVDSRAHRRDQGAGRRARARGLGRGVRRVLPVPRRHRCRWPKPASRP